jgi:transposase
MYRTEKIQADLPLPDIVQPKVLGVDVWAYSNVVTYGTILIDMGTSRQIDLLSKGDGQVLRD